MKVKLSRLLSFIYAFCVSSLFFLSAGYGSPAAMNSTSLDNPAFSLAPMIKKVIPAVVRITVEKSQKPSNPFKEGEVRKSHRHSISLGSGVIIDADQGLIVTNAHVVNQADIIVVTLNNGRRYRANLIGEDDGFDIAIIKIFGHHLSSLNVGDSDQLQVGDRVAAIGSPFGLSQTVTSGVVSALNRSEPKIEGFQNFIQTDTPINPGNSGGALVNMKGELVGINTAIFTPVMANIGIGFAIPSNMVKSVVDQILHYGKVKRGVLGVIGQDITPSLADAMGLTNDEGVVVTKVVPGSPADKAGIKVGDIIEKLNGKGIRSAQQLRNTLGITRPGTPVDLVLSRNDHEFTLKATVGSAKELMQQNAIPLLAGISFQNFHELENDGTYLNGAEVTNVAETSEGALAGILPGDVITDANNQTITSIEQLEKIALTKPKQLLLKISRGPDTLFLVIEPDSPQP